MDSCLGWEWLNGKQRCTLTVQQHWRTTDSHMSWLLGRDAATQGIDDCELCWWAPYDKKHGLNIVEAHLGHIY